jgi:c(7)-type cytochrome triheme protein
MQMCSTQRGTRRNKHGRPFLALVCAVYFLAVPGSGQVSLPQRSGQIYLPQPPAKQPSDYGKVILDNHSSTPGPGPVVFDHWLHRAKFTCRLCHVDIGFAMQANATGINASTNRQGFHCGACHDGKRLFEGNPIFAACSGDARGKECERCHSLGKRGVREYDYTAFTAKLPKGSFYGIDWMAAESKGEIKPTDFLEGISVKRARIQTREDFSIRASLSWVHPIVFSHEKHSTWNGCELCHPEIFHTARKETVEFSMFLNLEGRYCGACHGKVAFPLNNCSACHPDGPYWVP